MPRTGQTSTRVDTFDDDAYDEMHGPLRAGRGLSIAPLFALRKWIGGGGSFSAGYTWSETVGLDVRYAVSGRGALVLEAGYEHFNSTNASLSVAAGLAAELGYELRFPLDPRYGNQLLIVPGVGYEHIAYTPSLASDTPYALGGVAGRLRVSWRHMMAGSAALELGVEGGVGDFFYYAGSPGGQTADLQGVAGMVGVGVAVAWGM